MIALFNELLKDEPLWLRIIVIIVLAYFSVNLIVVSLSRFLEALDYLNESLWKKIKSFILLVKKLIFLFIKIIFFPITIIKLIQENNFYNQFIIINNERKEKVLCDDFK